MCRLDLAPEAPWRCPEDCPAYERKTIDAGWIAGSLAEPMQAAPEEVETTESVTGLLDEAELIINSAGPDIIDEVKKERELLEQEQPGLVGRLFKRKPKPKRKP